MQIKWSIISLCVLSVSVFAEPPGNGSRSGGGKPGDRSEQRGDRGNDRERGDNRGGPQDMEKFWKDFRAFCAENSPARYAEFERQTKKSGNEFRSRVLGRLWGGYHWYQELKKSNPDLYRIKTDQLKIEDKEFALLLAKKHIDDAERNPPAYLKLDKPLKADEIDAQLKLEAKAYVEVRLKEREYRIAQLETRIAEERKNLLADQSNKDKLVTDHLEQLEKDGLDPKRPPGPPGRRPEGEGAERHRDNKDRETVSTEAR